MGYLYVKVIESKKVAVRNSFFVNYPFIRVTVGKEKKSTNFKPGVEWWDKIFTYKGVTKGDHQQIIIQARDKSIHVFGSDWLGEIKLDLDTETLLDEQVHQMWYKFGRGRKPHSRAPRGYIHIAFQYSTEPIVGRRPFSIAPVEPVLSFEEWLAANNKNWTSDSSAWFPEETSTEPGWKVPESSLRKSAPAIKNSALSPDESRGKADVQSPPNSINPSKTSKYDKRKLSNTRQRALTMPDVRSPSTNRKQREDSSSEEEYESDEEPRTGNLIDLSFDAPKGKMTGQSAAPRSILKNSQSQPNVTVDSSKRLSIDDIKKLSLSTTHVEAPQGYEGFATNTEPTFADWYKPSDGSKPRNPFLDMHDNFEPAKSPLA